MQTILTEKAPKPLGHYSQAIRCGNFLFLSGQISIDPKTGEICWFDGNLVKQTELVLKNIEAILVSQKLSMASVAKINVFLKDISQFHQLNEVYAKFFGNHKPARTTVEVSNLPKGVAVEIEAIAYDSCLQP